MGDTTAAIDAMAAKRKGAVVKLESVSYFSGYSVSALHAMIKDGLPIAKGGGGPGKPILVDCARLIDWLVQRERERVVHEITGVSLERLQAAGIMNRAGAAVITSEIGEKVSTDDFSDPAAGGMLDWKLRQGVANARMKELELAKLEGELVEIEALEMALTNLVSIARSRLMALPARTSPLCAAAAGDVAEVRRILEASIREVLEELAAEKPEQLLAAMSEDVGAEERTDE